MGIKYRLESIPWSWCSHSGSFRWFINQFHQIFVSMPSNNFIIYKWELQLPVQSTSSSIPSFNRFNNATSSRCWKSVFGRFGQLSPSLFGTLTLRLHCINMNTLLCLILWIGTLCIRSEQLRKALKIIFYSVSYY